MLESDRLFNQDDPFPIRLKKLRDLFSDEIPPHMISSLTPKDQNFYKVRKTWFQGLTATLENALDEGEINNLQVKKRAQEFIERYTSPAFHQQPLVTADDITRANRIINSVLGETER